MICQKHLVWLEIKVLKNLSSFINTTHWQNFVKLKKLDFYMKFDVWHIDSKRHYIDYLFIFQCYQKMSLFMLKIWLARTIKRHNLGKLKVFHKILSHYTFSSQMSKVQKKVQNSKIFLSNESIEKLRLKNKILQWTEKGRKYLKCRRY